MLSFVILLVLLAVAEPFVSNNKYIDLQSLLRTVNTLNDDLTLQTNILMEFNNTTASDELNAIALHIVVPKLVVRTISNTSTSLVIESHFRSKLLSIVLLRGTENMEQVFNLLRSVLWQLHHSNVLFVNVAESHLPLEHIFLHCWDNGFTNVLALTKDRYYTYHRFPELKVVELSLLRDYYNKTHMRNWHGHPLRSTVLYGSPRSYHYIDRITGESQSTGYLYNLIIDFVNHYNATFVRKLIGANHSDLELACRAFKRREIDIMTTILYINPAYSRSIVPAILHVYVVVPHAQPLQNFLYFVKPLKRWAWTVVAFIGVVMLSLLTFIYRIQSDSERIDVSAALLQTLTMLFYLPHSSRPLRTRAQRCFMMLIIASGFMTNMYTSCLSSMLTSKLYEPQIEKYSDIARTQLLLPKAAFDIEIWSNLSSMSWIIKERLRTVPPKSAYELLRNLSTESLLADVEDRVDFFMYQQKFLRVPRVKKLDRVLHTIPSFIPFPHNSPYLQLFNKYLRHSFEHGLYSKFVNEANDEGIKHGEINFFESKYSPYMQLGLKHLDVFFVGCWAVGLFLSSIVFAMELVYFYCFNPY